MNIKKNFFFSFLVFFFLNNPSNSYANIYYIDLDKLLINTNYGKKIISELEDENKKNLEFLKKKQDTIKDEENNIIKLKNVISQDELNVKIDNLQKKITSFNEEKQKIIKNFNEIKDIKIKNFFNEVNPIIKNYMNDNKISILIDKKNVYISIKELEITNIIIDLINSKL